MPVDEQGRWRPNTSPAQDELRRICRERKFVLCNGPRFSGKTVGALHCLAEHAWLTNPCNVTVVSISQTVGLDSGIWVDLMDHVMAEWIGTKSDGTPWVGRDLNGNEIAGGSFGMQWIEPPHILGATKKPVAKVSNMFGGKSTIQLDSLQNEDEAENRFKPRRYSMIYVPELSTFHSRNTFDTWTESLRMIGLKESAHLFLADSNPPDLDSMWMYKLWWSLKDCPEEQLEEWLRENREKMTVDDAIKLRKELARIDITVPENPFADPAHVALLRAKYSHNDELYRRYILGECVLTTQDSLFVDVFRPNFHVVGEPLTPANKEPDLMYPEDDCFELLTGWDPGSSTNWAAVIAEKFYPKGEWAEKYKGKPCFKVLEEVMVIGEDVDAKAFVEEVVRKMKDLEQFLERHIKWMHWSDRSAFDMRDLESMKYYHQIIFELSDGEVSLKGAERGGGSVRAGLDLMRRLMWEERLWISTRCPTLINAIKAVRKGTSQLSPIQRGSPHKHPIDALRYILQSECYDELQRSVMLNVRRRRDEKRGAESGLVLVPL
jgi:hypothetical protein